MGKRKIIVLWSNWLLPKSGKKFVAKQVVGLNPLLATRR